jgi:hypothetical protein
MTKTTQNNVNKKKIKNKSTITKQNKTTQNNTADEFTKIMEEIINKKKEFQKKVSITSTRFYKRSPNDYFE